jgi:hypothetical protein
MSSIRRAMQLTYMVARDLREGIDEAILLMRAAQSAADADKEIRLGQSIHRQRKRRRQEQVARQVELIRGTKPKWLGRECNLCGYCDHQIVGLYQGEEHIEDICPLSYWLRVLQMHTLMGTDASAFLARYPGPKSLARPVAGA